MIDLLVPPIGKNIGHNSFKMLPTFAIGVTVDGVVPLALTRSIGGISTNKQTSPFDKLLLLLSVSLGKLFASL